MKKGYLAAVASALLLSTAMAGCSYTGAPFQARDAGNSTREDRNNDQRAAEAEAAANADTGETTE